MSSIATPRVGDDDLARATGDSAAHRWFVALDDRPIVLADRSWRIHIVGVHLDRDAVWIQCELTGHAPHSLVVRVLPDATVDEVIGDIAAVIQKSL